MSLATGTPVLAETIVAAHVPSSKEAAAIFARNFLGLREGSWSVGAEL